MTFFPEFLTNLPLKFDLSHGILKKFGQEMGELGFSEVEIGILKTTNFNSRYST